ncbi:MAG TPA: hypothetical protein VGN34_18535 [Ktedonobacteraceae bacterium]
MQRLSWLQRIGRALHISKAERHDTAGVPPMVSKSLDKKNAEPRREHVILEEREFGQLPLRGTTGKGEGGKQE